MPSFTEEATLKVNDQSSAKIRKINAELRKLAQTARQLQNMRINLNVNASGLQNANRLLNTLAHNASQIGRHPITLRVNTSGIQQAQRQLAALQAQARRGITVPPVGGGGGGHPPGGGGLTGPNVPPRRGRGGRRGFLGNVAYGVGRVGQGAVSSIIGPGLAGTAFAAGAAVGREILHGIKKSDIADTLLRGQQLDRIYGKGAMDSAEHAIKRIYADLQAEPGGAFWNMADVRKMFAEVLPSMGISRPKPGEIPGRLPDFVSPMRGILPQLQSLEATLVSYGHDQERAAEESLYFYKGLEQTGKLQTGGHFDPVKANEWFTVMRQMIPMIGREATGPFMQKMFKYLGGARYDVTPKALMAIALMNEEQGTRASVGFDALRNQLMGVVRNTVALKKLEKEGFMKLEYGPMGGVKGVKKGAMAGGEDVVDYQLLMSDMPAWIEKNMRPSVEKLAAKEADKLISEGVLLKEEKDTYVRLNNARADLVQAYVNEYNMSGRARDALASFLIRQKETQEQLDLAFARSGSVKDFRKLQEGSLVFAMAQLQNQFQGMVGEGMRALAPWMIAQARHASDVFSAMQTKFQPKPDPITGKKVITPPSVEDMAQIIDAAYPALLGASMSMMMDPKTAPLGIVSAAFMTAVKIFAGAVSVFSGKPVPGAGAPGGPLAIPETRTGEIVQEAEAKVKAYDAELKKAQAEITALKKQMPAPGMQPTRKDVPELERKLKDAEERARVAKEQLTKANEDLARTQLTEADFQVYLEKMKKAREDARFRETIQKREAERIRAARVWWDTHRKDSQPPPGMTKPQWDRARRSPKPPKGFKPPGFVPSDSKPVPVKVTDPDDVDDLGLPQPDYPPKLDPALTPPPGAVQPTPPPVQDPGLLQRLYDNLIGTAPKKISDAVDEGAGRGAIKLGDAGTKFGDNAESSFDAGGLGDLLGSRARAKLEGIEINVNANVREASGSPAPSKGPTPVIA